MRICSLVPGATEVVVMLGFGDSLVGISHECDYPASVRDVPILVQPLVRSDGTDSADIDRQVKALLASGEALYRVDAQGLALTRPDIILTQDLCHVCAVTPKALEQAMQSLSPRPQLLMLGPRSLADVIGDIERIGASLGAASRGHDLAQSLRSRIAAIRSTSSGRLRPRVVCLEWLNPLFIGGHWVPEMVEAAGGQDVLGRAGEPSRQVTMEEVRLAAPELIVVMPCGFSLARTVSEVTALCRMDAACLRLLSMTRTYAVDAASYFSRPGPRLVDGVQLLAEICGDSLHSDRRADAALDLTEILCLTGQS
jgi:iron complex transport system substrate-binding protein